VNELKTTTCPRPSIFPYNISLLGSSDTIFTLRQILLRYCSLVYFRINYVTYSACISVTTMLSLSSAHANGMNSLVARVRSPERTSSTRASVPPE